MKESIATVKAHRAQFLLDASGAEELVIPDGFSRFQLKEGGVILADPECEITDRGSEVSVGLRLPCGDGRHVSIKDGKLLLDATGTLGITYQCMPNNGLIASSSPHLLAMNSTRRAYQVARHAQVNWVPSPCGPRSGQKRLLWDEILDLRKRCAIQQPRSDVASMALDRAVEEVASLYCRSIQEHAETGRPLRVALTAGQDSRTILACLLATGAQFSAYTIKRSDGASLRDIRIARAICGKFGVKHEVLGPDYKGRDERLRQLNRHCGSIHGGDAVEYAAGNFYRTIPAGALVLHGGVQGLSKLPWAHLFRDVPEADSETACAKFLEYAAGQTPDVLHALQAWVVKRSESRAMSWSDLFFLDQRRGAWGADNRWVEDAFHFTWSCFGNIERAVSIAMSLPVDDRANANLQKGIIAKLVPEMEEHGFTVNPPLSKLEAWRGRMSRRGRHKVLERIKRIVTQWIQR